MQSDALPPARRLLIALAKGFSTIRRKIFLAFLITSVITACFGYFAVQSIGVTGVLMAETFDRVLMSINFARAAAADFTSMEAVFVRERENLADSDRLALNARIDELAGLLRDDLQVSQDRSLSPHAARAAQNTLAALDEWLAARDRLSTGRDNVANSWAEIDQKSGAVKEQLEILINHTTDDGFLHRLRAVALVSRTRIFNIAGVGLVVLLSGWVSTLLSRQIMGPVRAASAAAGQIASGELNATIPRAGSDELGALLGAMEIMRDNIRAMVGREVALRRSAQLRLTDAIESSQEGVLVLGADGRVAIANTRFGRLFPRVGRLAGDAGLSDVSEAAPELGLQAPGQGGTLAASQETQLTDGTWLRVGRSPTSDGGFVAICTDITALKDREAELSAINLCFDAALNNMSQGLCLFDAQARLRVSNPQFARLYELPASRLTPGMTVRELTALQFAAGLYLGHSIEELWTQQESERQRGADSSLRELPDGRVVSISRQPLADGGWVETHEDITERRLAEAQIDFLARHDPVTRLPNRVMFREQVEQAVAQLGRGTPFAILTLGLLDFKLINDVFGFTAGETLLRSVADRLAACVRDMDTVARLDADEFVILQIGVREPEEAGELAARLLEFVSGVYPCEDQEITLSVSLGIAVAPADGNGCDGLIRNAELALERARADGRNTYRFFEPEMDARLQARRNMQQDLHQALARNEFELYYQPLVEVSTERVCGFEALLRWSHPSRGMVSPGEFIPVAEDTGLIVDIGEWVLRQACREAALWPAEIKVAVNVSPLQFKSPALLGCVKAALQDSGLRANRLELEVTETVLLRDDGATLQVLHQIRDLGVRVSMDDFGTGYSSLSYLRSFPFDKIKVDQSFVRDLATKLDSVAIIRAIAGLGLTLGMRTTAEGVETVAQLDEVKAAGCTEIQGYYFSRPVPAGRVAGLIRDIAARVGQPSTKSACQLQLAGSVRPDAVLTSGSVV